MNGLLFNLVRSSKYETPYSCSEIGFEVLVTSSILQQCLNSIVGVILPSLNKLILIYQVCNLVLKRFELNKMLTGRVVYRHCFIEAWRGKKVHGTTSFLFYSSRLCEVGYHACWVVILVFFP
jgi:hypothetical protein